MASSCSICQRKERFSVVMAIMDNCRTVCEQCVHKYRLGCKNPRCRGIQTISEETKRTLLQFDDFQLTPDYCKLCSQHVWFQCRDCHKEAPIVQEISLLELEKPDELFVASISHFDWNEVLCGSCLCARLCLDCRSVDADVVPLCDKNHKYCNACLHERQICCVIDNVTFCYWCFPFGLYQSNPDHVYLFHLALKELDFVPFNHCTDVVNVVFSYVSPWPIKSSDRYHDLQPKKIIGNSSNECANRKRKYCTG